MCISCDYVPSMYFLWWTVCSNLLPNFFSLLKFFFFFYWGTIDISTCILKYTTWYVWHVYRLSRHHRNQDSEDIHHSVPLCFSALPPTWPSPFPSPQAPTDQFPVTTDEFAFSRIYIKRLRQHAFAFVWLSSPIMMHLEAHSCCRIWFLFITE